MKVNFGRKSVSQVGAVLKAVCKDLKNRGEGSTPHAKDELTQMEDSSLYDKRIAGPHNPRALQNAVVINKHRGYSFQLYAY